MRKTVRRTSRTNKSQVSVDGLKKLFNLDHSEELFGIMPEIPIQCPRIDSFLEDLDNMYSHMRKLRDLIRQNYDNINEPYITRECNIIDEYKTSLICAFEEVRTACDSLRTRGTAWKNLARNMFNEVPNNKKFINSKFKV